MVFRSPLLLLLLLFNLLQVQFDPSKKGLNSDPDRPLDVIFLSFFIETLPHLFLSFIDSSPNPAVVIKYR